MSYGLKYRLSFDSVSGTPYEINILERTHPSGAVFGALHFRSFRCIRYGLRRSGLTEKYSFRSERQAFRV